MILSIIGTLTMALAAILIYMYYLRSGQFDDPEDVKYQVFHDDEE